MFIDDWIARKIGLPIGETLTRDALEKYQLEKLNETLEYVYKSSPFYREKLKGKYNAPLLSLAEIAALPFTTPDELKERGEEMLCLPLSQIDRIVTLPTSGSTGAQKRVYFTEADQELMTDYIANGLPIMTGKDDTFIVLVPCDAPGSVGRLVAEGVERIGSRAIMAGAVPKDGSQDKEILKLMASEGVTTGFATPSTAARLAQKSREFGLAETLKQNIRTFLLSAEYVLDADKELIEQIWNCKTFEHYGMTEMGLGGAMACEYHEGYHIREADLLFEIVAGEIVFTTLTRKAMPLVRYKTGDFSRFLDEPCPCGSILKRIAKVGDRNEHKAY